MVGKDDIILGETFFGGGRGGEKEDVAGSEMEEEDRAVFAGDCDEGSVDGCGGGR